MQPRRSSSCETDAEFGSRGQIEGSHAEKDVSKVEMVEAVPWRKSDDDAKMEGERRKKVVVVMDGVQGEDGDGGARSSAVEVVCTSHGRILISSDSLRVVDARRCSEEQLVKLRQDLAASE